MKYLLLSLFLLIAMPSAQAGLCVMQAGQDAATTAQQGPVDTADEHDCCPGGAGDDSLAADEGCESGSHCGACYLGASAIPVTSSAARAELPVIAPVFLASFMASSHFGPPFRPPIA